MLSLHLDIVIMIIAQQKRKENIVEYLLYMWQVEDLIRACRFDMEEIEAQLLSKYEQPEAVMREIRQWYQELIDEMKEEGIMEKGHLRQNNDTVSALNVLHDRLLRSSNETVYGSLYYKVLPAIVQLRAQAGDARTSEMETCLTAVYGYVLLKMQRKDISDETTESVKDISRLLAFLAAKYV